MAQKVVVICDPGIDGAFAVALALHDRDLNILGVAATAGKKQSEKEAETTRKKQQQQHPQPLPSSEILLDEDSLPCSNTGDSSPNTQSQIPHKNTIPKKKSY